MPTDPKLEKRGEPSWTAENMAREKGATTFKTCGWCAYAGGGSYRYGAMLSGSCSLLKDYRNEVNWDTPCKVTSLSKQDIKSLIDYKLYEIKRAESSIKTARGEISILNGLKPAQKPPLPENREYSHFKIKDVVYVFHDGKWNRGVVAPGYRTHDGCVSYVLDAYEESQGGKKGPWGCGNEVPCILLEWEYEFFKKDLKEFEAWLNACDRAYNGDKLPMKDYLQAMKANSDAR